MNQCNEFKAKFKSNNYLYSYLIISSTFYDKYLVFPDACDYIVLSSKGYFDFIETSNELQSLELDDEELFILRLKPYTLKLLLKNKYLLREKLIELIPAIYKTKSILKKAELINTIFYNIPKSNQLTKLMECINIIYSNNGNIKIENLSEKTNISIRTIQRLFKEYTNFTPKEYINIIKFQSDISVIKKIKYHKTYQIPEHYYDYSHFFKSFKKYTKISPNQFYNTYLKHIKSIYDIY